MRYSRFRQHMEGGDDTTRKSKEPRERRRAKVTKGRKERAKNGSAREANEGSEVGTATYERPARQVHQREPLESMSPSVKTEPDYDHGMGDDTAEPYIKTEPVAGYGVEDDPDPTYIKNEADSSYNVEEDPGEGYVKAESRDQDLPDGQIEGAGVNVEDADESQGGAFAQDPPDLSVGEDIAAMREEFLEVARANDLGDAHYLF